MACGSRSRPHSRLGMRSFLDTRVLKTLDAGNTVLFGALALYKGFVQPGLSFGAFFWRSTADCWRS